MYRNNQESTDNHAYRGGHHNLGARENALKELSSLIDRIDNKIKSLANYIRNVNKGDNQAINKVNLLKRIRSTIKKAYHKTFAASTEEWENMRSEIQDTFNDANDKVFVGKGKEDK